MERLKHNKNRVTHGHTISGSFLQILLESKNYELVNVRIADFQNQILLSHWEELFSGSNNITVDVSGLKKGYYSVLVQGPKGNILKTYFTKL